MTDAGGSPATRPLLLAHRGDHRRHRENTLAALQAAVAVPGVDGVEVDVRASRDGEPMLLHDETLARVFGHGLAAREATAAELAHLGVAHLADALAAIPAWAFVDIDLKEPPTTATIAAIRSARGPGLANGVVSAFDPGVLAQVGRELPDAPRWLNAGTLGGEVVAAAQVTGCAGIAVDWHGLTGIGLARAGGAGLVVATWTVRRGATLERLLSMPLAAICVEGPALSGPMRRAE